jgi:hypothetical protein
VIFLNIFRVLSKYYFYSFEFRLRFTSKGKKGPSDGFNFRALILYMSDGQTKPVLF